VLGKFLLELSEYLLPLHIAKDVLKLYPEINIQPPAQGCVALLPFNLEGKKAGPQGEIP